MITILIIAIIVYVIYSKNKKKEDSTSSVQLVQNVTYDLSALPDVHIVGKDLGGVMKVMNGVFSDSKLLREFRFDSGRQRIYIRMGDGTVFEDELNNIRVDFSTVKRIKVLFTTRVITNGTNRIELQDSDVLGYKQWSIINSVLVFAREIYGNKAVFFMGEEKLKREAYKELSKYRG